MDAFALSAPLRCPPSCPELTRRRVLRAMGWAAASMGALALPAAAMAAEPALRFGILPIGGALESRNDWSPLLAQLSTGIGRRIEPFAVPSYEVLEAAIEHGEVEMAYLSGRIAVDAVVQHNMQVIAQIARRSPFKEGYPATLMVLSGGPVRSLEDVLARPERWRLARGSKTSLSGYVVPQLELFLPHGIRMETRFASELITNHQTTALALVNRDVDVGLTNSADFERFRQQFPQEASRLKVLWASEPIPHEVIVISRRLPERVHAQARTFFIQYGRGAGAQGDAERAVLKSLHDFAGFTLRATAC